MNFEEMMDEFNSDSLKDTENLVRLYAEGFNLDLDEAMNAFNIGLSVYSTLAQTLNHLVSQVEDARMRDAIVVSALAGMNVFPHVRIIEVNEQFDFEETVRLLKKIYLDGNNPVH